MLNKAVRIMIADRRHEHRLCIEKMLNALGYFRILPVESFEDACLLTRVSSCPVDILIIDENLRTSSLSNRISLLPTHPRAPYILPYKSSSLAPRLASWCKGTYIWDTMAGLPDLQVLKSAMSTCMSDDSLPESFASLSLV